MALRQILELGCGALVMPEQLTVGRAAEAFDDMDNLKDEATRPLEAPRAPPRRVGGAMREGRSEGRADDAEAARPPDRRARPAVGAKRAGAWSTRLGDAVSFYKIGYQLAFAGGLAFARALIARRQAASSSI